MHNDLVLCDVPSGGCYLSDFIENDLKIVSVETSKEFIKDSHDTAKNSILLCQDIGDIPLESSYLDRILSVAGLHHVEGKVKFYREAHRLLKVKGIFSLADALQDSNVAKFLDIFVHQHSTMGHQGSYLNASTAQELEFVGFQVVHDTSAVYHWYFDSVASMIHYCQLLFGIDRANEEQVLTGIERYLGYSENDGKCYMNWGLHFIKAVKRSRSMGEVDLRN